MNCNKCKQPATMLTNGRCPACGPSANLMPAPPAKKQGDEPKSRRQKRKEQTQRKMSSLESAFAAWAQVAALPPWETEYRFSEERKFRLDFAWPAEKVGVELEGGIFSGGRHGRGAGIQGDIEKNNHALLKGWRVLRYSAVDLRDRPLVVIEEVKAALGLPF